MYQQREEVENMKLFKKQEQKQEKQFILTEETQALYSARMNRIVEASWLYAEVERLQGNVSKSHVKKIHDKILHLQAFQDDEWLVDIVKGTIEAMNYALAYIQSKDKVDLQRMIDVHNATDEIVYKFADKIVYKFNDVRKEGKINGH